MEVPAVLLGAVIAGQRKFITSTVVHDSAASSVSGFNLGLSSDSCSISQLPDTARLRLVASQTADCRASGRALVIGSQSRGVEISAPMKTGAGVGTRPERASPEFGSWQPVIIIVRNQNRYLYQN